MNGSENSVGKDEVVADESTPESLKELIESDLDNKVLENGDSDNIKERDIDDFDNVQINQLIIDNDDVVDNNENNNDDNNQENNEDRKEKEICDFEEDKKEESNQELTNEDDPTQETGPGNGLERRTSKSLYEELEEKSRILEDSLRQRKKTEEPQVKDIKQCLTVSKTII